MASFSYRARDMGGQLVRGHLEAEDPRQAAARLRSQGLLVLELDPDRDLGRAVAGRSGGLWRRRPTAGELAVLCRQLGTMEEAGLPLLKCLEVLARQATNRMLRTALARAATHVEAGESLAAALGRSRDVFPPVMIHLVASGEVGGMLGQVLDRLAAQLEREEAVRQKVRSAMTYPLVVSVLAVAMVGFLVTFVMPRFARFFAEVGAPLPLPTRILLSISHVALHYWWAFGLGAAAVILMVRRYLQTPGGRAVFEKILLRLPVAGPLAQKYAVARFARVLSGLLAGGIPILKALAVAEKVLGIRLLGQAVLAALDAVRKGESLAPPLERSRLFPPMLMEMIRVGEQSGALDEMLLKSAEFYEEEVQRMAERLSSTLEPLMICCLAVVVGMLVVSLVSPIFDMWSLIG